MLTRDEAVTMIENSVDAATLFAHHRYRELAAVLHPDRNPGDPRAHEAAATLNRLYADWKQSRRQTVTTATAAYPLTRPHAVGSIATTYRTTGPHLVKIVRDPALNPLIHAEWAALRTLDGFTERHRWLRPYYPRLLDISGPVARGDRAFSVLDPLIDGFITLADIAKAFPDGLDGRDYAWMHRRLLRAVAGAHRAGVVHGHLTADNVLVHPGQHGIVLAGWSFAVEDGALPLAADKSVDYPPEIRKGLPMTAATDVHMLHSLMLSLLAPRETRQREFATWCAQESPGRRPDATDLLDEYDDLLGELYGPRTFRPFIIPETGV
ncbi:adenylate cyclase [Amycolatopsis coloradensis]|uniref:Adenylate cyclase n=1 Tax=Amycolatopsis coloradensis TaxID=76021 RepID=A0A1R0KSZ9_9PSEU|nr:adenylate cyclase [Amycolatopsis coloradensis]OLZ51054.1 adenylate cyclase [Amycolatopsis coloradensis]